ncbi:MAG: replicative DNA helicase [Deltaproteobacteria bacterium]|nr:replicative DNA helicase [Deltaproteobacteria bacterium]
MRKKKTSSNELQVTIPYSSQAEKAVLGAILIEPNFSDYAVESLQIDDFYEPKNQIIFSAVLELVRRRMPVDAVSIAEMVKKTSAALDFEVEEYLKEILNSVPVISYPLAHIKILKETSLKRQILRVAAEISNQAVRPDVEVEELFAECDQKWAKLMNQRDFHPYSDLSKTLVETIELVGTSMMGRNSGSGLWISTKYKELNKLIGGLGKGDLIIIAARPGMGKTAFVLNIACEISFKQGLPVGFFSLEMSKEQIGIRILSLRTGIESSAIKTGNLTKDEYNDLAEEAERLASKPFFIDDTASITLTDLRVKARRLVREQNVKVIFIDYLQLIRNLSSHIHTREQEISEISRSLKALAKDLNIPVIALSQLNRAVEGRENKRPVLSDLRESGAIEQDADIIMFLYREDFYKSKDESKQGIAEVIVAKHRNGPTGTVKLAFIKENMAFENISDYNLSLPVSG